MPESDPGDGNEMLMVLQFREYLEANGYDTSQMGLIDTVSSVSVDLEKDKKEMMS